MTSKTRANKPVRKGTFDFNYNHAYVANNSPTCPDFNSEYESF